MNYTGRPWLTSSVGRHLCSRCAAAEMMIILQWERQFVQTMEFSIKKRHHTNNQLKCDASLTSVQLFESDYNTHLTVVFSLFLRLREPKLLSKLQFLTLSLPCNIQKKQDLLLFASVARSNKTRKKKGTLFCPKFLLCLS